VFKVQKVLEYIPQKKSVKLETYAYYSEEMSYNREADFSFKEQQKLLR